MKLQKLLVVFLMGISTSNDIIIESLTYSTSERIPSKEELGMVINAEIKRESKEALLDNPLAIWLEMNYCN